MVLLKPFLSLNEGIMTNLLQNFQSGFSNLLSQLLGIMEHNFCLGSNLGHNISHDHCHFSLHWCNHVVDGILKLFKFFRDFLS